MIQFHFFDTKTLLNLQDWFMILPTQVDQKVGEKDDKEAIVRKLYGLESTDPNVTFALCYGTRSSPAVIIKFIS